MEIKLISHSAISESELDVIINIKNLYWKYSIQEHINWIHNNIFKEDIHVFLMDKENVLGYLNLVKTVAFFDDIEKSIFGVGNVCVINEGQGFGGELLKRTQKFIFDNKQIAMLFCKDSLMNFYNQVGWQVVQREKINSEMLNRGNVMLYNNFLNYDTFYYNGRNF